MFKFKRNIDLSGYTLLLPSVSVGNVGQLVADLLICNLHMEKVASLWSPAIVPVAGSDPFDLHSKSLMVSSELFVNEKQKIAILHIRSTLSKRHATEFLNTLVDSFVKFNICKLIIIASSFAHERHSISTVPFRYLVNGQFPAQNKEFEQLGWIAHGLDGNTVIHGGGYAKSLFEICTLKKLPTLVIFKYCSEGDNAPDAKETLNYLNNWAKILPDLDEDNSSIITPPSWNLLFGSPPPSDIY